MAPPVPHEVVDCDAYTSHVPATPPLQQPCGHVAASHEHSPLVVSHSWFAHSPQAAPAAPHWPVDCDS
jgi:hypothetical protein